MSAELVLRLAGGVLLVASNAFFVASEFALTRVRQYSAEEFEETSALRRAWEMTGEMEIYLTACQVGITFSSVLLGIVAEPALTELLRPAARALGVGAGAVPAVSVLVAVLLINVAHTVYGEQIPTYLGVERPRFVSQYLAPILYWWTRLMSPLIHGGDWLAKATLRPLGIRITRSWTDAEAEGEDVTTLGELRRQMGDLLSRGALSRERRREVMNALEIGGVPVREIMVPRAEATVLSLDRSVEENLEEIGRSRYGRYPLCRSEGGEVVGVIYVPALFEGLDRLGDGDADLREYAFDPVYVEEDRPVSGVIDRLQDAGQELALVRDGGRVTGLVTITDAFEAIAGDVEDPLD